MRKIINKVFVNQLPENDIVQYKKANLVTGNLKCSDMAKNGRKILIISDSITSMIQTPEFNRYIKKCHAYRKYFADARPTELPHYCLPTLISDQPDTVIIHVDTN